MKIRKKLPIGVQSFAKIREDDYYYVDKTPFVARPDKSRNYSFLSRSRRFEKFLLKFWMSTIQTTRATQAPVVLFERKLTGNHYLRQLLLQ
jgi:hypothetical protein